MKKELERENMVLQSINRVRMLYLSCKDKEFNKFIGAIMAGDVKLPRYNMQKYNL